MSPAGSWRPTFPGPSPRHWVCFAAVPSAVSMWSDIPLRPVQRTWLVRWLEAHSPREAEVEASYVYLGLAPDWWTHQPDGRVSPSAVIGVGAGSDFGEPPGAVDSTVGEIWAGAIEVLKRT
jgi:hypothetical protein